MTAGLGTAVPHPHDGALNPFRSSRAAVAAWALLLLLLSSSGLGGAPLFDVDEGAFGEATREMLVSGDWGHTTLNGEPRWDKPILTYWLQALSVRIFGLHEWALRLPSALAGWAWSLALLRFAAPRWGVGPAAAASGLLAVSFGGLLIGRAATADALLNLWLTLALLDLWRSVELSDPASARRGLRRAALWIGLGVLTKGPVALLIPAATAGLWIATGPRAHWGRRLRALLGDAVAWLILAGVALPWYVYALLRHGEAFVDGFLLRHNLQRWSGPLEGHGGSLGYYLLVLPLLLLPWTPLLLPLLARTRRLWQDGAARWLLLWAGFVLVFFSLSGTKLPHYALYGCTPLALLAGRELQRWLRPWSARPRRGGLLLLWASLLAWAWAGVAVAALLQARAGRIADPYYRALLGEAPADLAELLAAAVLVSLVLVAAGVAVLRRSAALAPWRLPLCGLVAAVLLLQQVWVLLPWWGERLQGPVRDAAMVARQAMCCDAGEGARTAVQWGLHQPSFAVYLGQETPRRAPRPGELALVRRDRLQSLAARLERTSTGTAPRWEVLYDQRGLMLLRWDAAAASSGTGMAGRAARTAPAAL